jgi:superfamily II RNA helicase
MIDPATLALAASAFAAVKKGFALGKDVEGMYQDISRWMGAVHEIETTHNKQKQGFFNKSVQEEALQTWAAMKKIKQQREELRLFMLSQNPQAWNEFVSIEGQIRKDRLRAEQRRKARIKKNIEITLITILMICIGVGLWFLVWFAMKARGLL